MLDELRQIRGLLTPKPPAEAPKPTGVKDEFIEFITKYKLLGLAVAFIIGVYLGALVQAFVNDIIMPLLEYVVPNTSNWEGILLGPLRVGHFFGALLTFIIIMLVIFLMMKAARKYHIE